MDIVASPAREPAPADRPIGWMAGFLDEGTLIPDIAAISACDDGMPSNDQEVSAYRATPPCDWRALTTPDKETVDSRYAFFDVMDVSTEKQEQQQEQQQQQQQQEQQGEVVKTGSDELARIRDALKHDVQCAPEVGQLLLHLPQLRGLRVCAAFKKNITRHRCTIGRLRWLASWIGDDPRDAQARTRILARIWNDVAHFRPFTTITEAARVVEARRNEIVIRLSSTMPGYVSVSYYHHTLKRAQHRRYAIKSVRSRPPRSLRTSGYISIQGDEFFSEERSQFNASSEVGIQASFVSGYQTPDDISSSLTVQPAASDRALHSTCVGAEFEEALAPLYGTAERFEGYITNPATTEQYYSVAELAAALCAQTPPDDHARARELMASGYVYAT